jgi:hypothetical protein
MYLELLASRSILRLTRPNWRYITDSHEASRNSVQSSLRCVSEWEARHKIGSVPFYRSIWFI